MDDKNGTALWSVAQRKMQDAGCGQWSNGAMEQWSNGQGRTGELEDGLGTGGAKIKATIQAKSKADDAEKWRRRRRETNAQICLPKTSQVEGTLIEHSHTSTLTDGPVQ
ncbi:hypothetical protein ANO14919_109830 [Xylariales sp. No.14919]|nr:hypothetical protein ANO14919_109830 [Xylariales sp. No.14919]